MKHLILGSSGQIGRHLCDFIKQKTSDTFYEFDIEHSRYEDLRLNSNYLLEKCIDECDFIHFLAFDVGGSKYLKKYQNTYSFINNNIKLMSNTFDLINQYKKPFIFASSQMSNMSYSTYGVLKKIGESYTESIGGIVTHFWNVYGIEKDFQKSHVITDFIMKALKNNCIDMITDGEESRQFLYADDCSEALYTIANKFSTLEKNKPYHITSFSWSKIIDIAKMIQLELNCKIVPSTIKDSVQLDQMNPPDTSILEYWQPKTDLRDGIKKIISYYRSTIE